VLFLISRRLYNEKQNSEQSHVYGRRPTQICRKSGVTRLSSKQIYLLFLAFSLAFGFSVVCSAGLWSPITPFNGQTLNAGHCLQLATMAIGHKVISILLVGLGILKNEQRGFHFLRQPGGGSRVQSIAEVLHCNQLNCCDLRANFQ
jgi:hypothetical protein